MHRKLHVNFKGLAATHIRPLIPPRIPESRSSYHDDCKIQPVVATYGSIDLASFCSMAWEPDIPIHLQNFHHLPAMNNWFTSNAEEVQVSFRDKLKSHANALVSYELMTTSSHKESPSRCPSKCLEEFYTWLKTQTPKDDSHLIHEIVGHVIESAKNNQSRFQQFESPLSLLIWACHFNKTRDNSLDRIRQLYIAQSDIRSLPIPIVEDLPVPKIVMQAGRGDIYSSSIWLGLQPTYTPLHRDPNPNLFCQLVGVKAVRLMQPKAGLSVFQEVRRKLRSPGNSRFRGPEMMDGPERDGLHHAIWVEPNASKSMWQAILSPGDALFIPQGWWHTVISLGDEAELNASANWWFR